MNYGENEGEERHLVAPEILAYIQRLLRSSHQSRPDQGARGDKHKKFYTTQVTTFKSRWGPYSKLLLKALETWHNQHPPGTTMDRSKSEVPTQESTIISVDDGLPLESGSDDGRCPRDRGRACGQGSTGGQLWYWTVKQCTLD